MGDGGTNWALQDTGNSIFLWSVCFPRNLNTGYIVGVDGAVRKTTDSGATWFLHCNIARINNLFFAQFPVDAQTCYIGGQTDTLHKTTDLGVSWRPQGERIAEVSHFLSSASFTASS